MASRKRRAEPMGLDPGDPPALDGAALPAGRRARAGVGLAGLAGAALRALRAIALVLAGALAIHMVAFAFLPPVSLLMVERWLSGQPVTRIYMPIEAISPRLIASVIASEDGQFCRHHGVDLRELREVLEQAWEDEEAPTRGASTLTMQVVKNLYLWPLPVAMRKPLEAPLALALDLAWSKERILEVYLNIAEWGPEGEIGAEAGARRAFGKSARDLTPRQAALLATSLPNPVRRNPAKPSRRQALVAGVIERRARSADLPLDCVRRAARP